MCLYRSSLSLEGVATISQVQELESPAPGEGRVGEVGEVHHHHSLLDRELQRRSGPAQQGDGGLGPGQWAGDLQDPGPRPGEDHSVHHLPLVSADLAGVPHLAVGGVVLEGPGAGAVYGLTIDLQPLTQLSESLLILGGSVRLVSSHFPCLEHRNDNAVLVGPDVHEEVPPAADGDGELPDQLLHAVDIGQLHVPPVSPALPEG